MKTLNISDELYLEITKTLNDTRNSKNSITHELESQQIDLGTALSELKHPSAVTELLSAEKALQSNIELLNTILRVITHKNTSEAIVSVNNLKEIRLGGHND